MPHDAPTAGTNLTFTLSGATAELEGLVRGAGLVLFVKNGMLDYLEGFTYDEPWPEAMPRYRIWRSEFDESNNLRALNDLGKNEASVMNPQPVTGPGEWLVGLESWVIADGNYDGFALDEISHFALEFTASGFTSAPAGSLRAERVGDGYEVEAAVVLAEPRLAVIDFGLGAYTEQPPPCLVAGSFVRGNTRLWVDPFFYFETHDVRRDVPPLIYSWTITGLWWETAPFVEGGKGLGAGRGSPVVGRHRTHRCGASD